MLNFGHRLKRLESRTGVKSRFDYWLVLAGASLDKRIQDIEAGKIKGKMGSRFDPEKKHLIIILGVPRPSKLKSKKETSPYIRHRITSKDNKTITKVSEEKKPFQEIPEKQVPSEPLGEKLIPLTPEEVEKIFWGDGRRGYQRISEKSTLISDN